MKKILLSLSRICVLLLIFVASNIHSQVLEQDSLALVAFYHSTNGDNWVNNGGWLKAPVANWYGVHVENERVKNLHLVDNNLSGSIPPEFGNLTQLEHILFYRNKLTGMIPVQIGNLTELRSLYLEENLLTGNIPLELGNLIELKELYLHNNQFVGSIPGQLGNLKKLIGFTLGENELTGAIPANIWDLTELIELDLCGNNLTGSIPKSIGNLVDLERLYLCGNQLSGKIPNEIGNLVQLTSLYLAGNQLDGEIPPEIFNITKLERLVLSENQLMGSVPVEIGKLKNVRFINLEHNRLSGAFPPLAHPVYNFNRRLHINNNLFTELPFFEWVGPLKVQSNKLTFEDIEPNISIPDFEYSPQDSLGKKQDSTLAIGSSLSLSVSVGGLANQYQWIKDGIEISGATDSIYTIDTITLQDSGEYICKISNTIATELILYSRPIIVTINGTSEIQNHFTEIPRKFVLEHNYPNPFNSSTNISYQLSRFGEVKLSILNIQGQIVKTLVDEIKDQGIYCVSWDGRNDAGSPVAGGIYIFQLQFNGSVAAKKLLLLK
ncbi:T9SS type A sorting domain-containing protein [candidate division KSB1 bacterium]|nr:T9SS type A sorting domain-containing protein [candidate division KSB1 bacterium]